MIHRPPAGRLVLSPREYGRKRKAWHAARQNGLGASEVAAVVGDGTLHPYLTPLDVWLSKTGPVAPEQVPSEAAEWGNVLEADVARMFAKRHKAIGHVAQAPGLYAHDDHPWMLATPDRLLVSLTDWSKVVALLEIKTVGKYAYDQHWEGGRPPNHILIQVQQQLAVCGLTDAYVAVLVGGQWMPPPVHVERDDIAISRIIDDGEAWWTRHILKGERPEPTFAPGRALGDYWPDPRATAVVLDDDARVVLNRYRHARNAYREAKTSMDHAAFEVGRVLDGATQLIDEDGGVVATFREQATRRFDIATARTDNPELVEKYTRVDTSRVLRVKGEPTS